MTERDIMKLEDDVRYLKRELSVAVTCIQTLESQVQSLQLGAPRGIEAALPSSAAKEEP